MIIFYNRRGAPNNGVRIVEVGRVFLEDGKIQIEPPDFGRWLRTQKGSPDDPLNPEDGEKYLSAVRRRYAAGTYLFTREQSSGGANPGGAERA